MPRIGMTGSVVGKEQINSHGRAKREYERIPDEKNIHICMNCPFPNCKKGTCELVRKKKEKTE